MIAIMLPDLMDLPGSERLVGAGAYLFHRGDAVTWMMVVLAGEVRLVRHQPDGRMVILQRARGVALIAEASLFSDTYHCDGVAESSARLRLIDRALVRRRFDADPAFASLWLRHLAGEIRDARLRSEILALKRIGDRLDAWLAWHETMPEKGGWKRLAEDIGVTPEALYREMARRRQGQPGPR